MEEARTIPHWASQILYAVASFLAGSVGYKYLIIYLNRHKPAAEVHKSEAETTEITIRSHSTAGDAVIRMMDRLEETQERIDDIREENLILKDEVFTLRTKLETQEIELKLGERQTKRMKALMDIHQIAYSELDFHKEEE